jgi:hypothetical protein
MTGMRGSSAMPQDEVRRIEGRIRREAGRFDIPSLLTLLETLGWRRDEIRFMSHHSTTSQPGLVHGVRFISDPRRVEIVLNLGLLSAQSPLPSYFFKRMEEVGFDADAFAAFVGFVDHGTLSDFVHALFPETDERLFQSWELYKRRELQLLNLASTATLQWLFETVFPDLGVTIEKAVVQRELETGTVRLGTAILGGDAVLGRKVRVPVQTRRVALVSESERASSGKAWPVEIRERLDAVILPILASVGVDIEVQLEVRSQQTWARLESQSYLGYDRMQGGQASYRRIRLFSGYTKKVE